MGKRAAGLQKQTKQDLPGSLSLATSTAIPKCLTGDETVPATLLLCVTLSRHSSTFLSANIPVHSSQQTFQYIPAPHALTRPALLLWPALLQGSLVAQRQLSKCSPQVPGAQTCLPYLERAVQQAPVASTRYVVSERCAARACGWVVSRRCAAGVCCLHHVRCRSELCSSSLRPPPVEEPLGWQAGQPCLLQQEGCMSTTHPLTHTQSPVFHPCLPRLCRCL